MFFPGSPIISDIFTDDCKKQADLLQFITLSVPEQAWILLLHTTAQFVFNFIYTATVKTKIASRRFTECHNLNPEWATDGRKNLPFNSIQFNSIQFNSIQFSSILFI